MPNTEDDPKKSVFKSPAAKLVAFFNKSRDNWKSKYKKAKYRAKLLSGQVRYWKEQSAELKLRVKELEKEIEKSEKKNSKVRVDVTERFRDVPACHKYSYGHIYLFVQFVLAACISMRATSRVLEIVSSFLGLEIDIPCWTTGRLWLLRIGLYKLERAKQIADDWIWIIDHTVQLGKEKCMVILGIRREKFPKCELYLTHEDIEPIELIPVEQSNGEVVYQQLEEAIGKTGIPMQIVSDHGTDIKSGVEKFCKKYNTVHTYDTKHKGAAILKRELKGDPEWEEFSKRASKTSKEVQQTELSGMAPPNQRSKARYMNLDKLVDWGTKTLLCLDAAKREQGGDFESCRMNEKFGWVCKYRDQLEDWKRLVEMVGSTNKFINFMGLYKGIDTDLHSELDELPENQRFAHVKEELIGFAREQQSRMGDEDRLLGSSEIIESVIGKYKGLQHDQVKGGFTGMLLGLPALLSDLNMETVQKAIDSVPTKKVWQWTKDKIGKSVYSQRKEFNKIAKEMEQKLDDKLCPA
jgi:archaellum component FlaC